MGDIHAVVSGHVETVVMLFYKKRYVINVKVEFYTDVEEKTMSSIINIMLAIISAFLHMMKSIIMNLYDEFEMVCGDIYDQLFFEWSEKNCLNF